MSFENIAADLEQDIGMSNAPEAEARIGKIILHVIIYLF